MALPPLIQPNGINTIPHRKADGVYRPQQQFQEPGAWYDNALNDVQTANYPPGTQITDYELTGTFPSSATWTITVTPLTTQFGTAAAAQAMQPASASFTATADIVDDVVLGLIAAVEAAGSTLALSAISSWTRIRSYITVGVGASASKIRLTSRSPNATFDVTITSTEVGDSFTPTVIEAPVTETMKVGFYVAIDRTKGLNGFDQVGHPYIKKISASTPGEDIIGPVYLGDGTQPVDRGFAFREYKPGQNVPLAKYGHPNVYGEKAIPLASGPEPVYVRHTDSGDFLAGLATDAAGAAAGATANVWTMTPVVVNDTLYQLQIEYGTEVEVLTYLSDGTATDAEINAGILAQLNLRNVTGGPLEGITGVGGATLVLTGPGDGRSFTPTSIGVGDMGEVETTPGVTTHTLVARGDKFLIPSTRIGPVPTDVPIKSNV